MKVNKAYFTFRCIDKSSDHICYPPKIEIIKHEEKDFIVGDCSNLTDAKSYIEDRDKTKDRVIIHPQPDYFENGNIAKWGHEYKRLTQN